MIKRESWDAFRKTGLLWWVNRALHLFGWAICVKMNDDGTHVKEAFPARCRYRGFAEDSEEQGFEAVTRYMIQDSPRLLSEMLEERRLAAEENVDG